MTREQCDFLCDALRFREIDYSRRDEYSGRGMFGKQTCAVVVDRQLDVASAVAGYLKSFHGGELGDSANLDAIPELDGLNWDNMGRQVIVY